VPGDVDLGAARALDLRGLPVERRAKPVPKNQKRPDIGPYSMVHMSIINWVRSRIAASSAPLPSNIFRYVLVSGGVHQLLLLALGVSVFLLEIVPLELQRQIVNDFVTGNPYRRVISLCLIYAGAVLVQGGTKLVSTSIAVGSANARSATCASGSTRSLWRLRPPHPQPRLKGLRFQ
jgi:hypothetical protein